MNQNNNRIDSILKALELEAHSSTRRKAPQGEGNTARFITISQQAGAGGNDIASQLAEAINRLRPEATPWCAWDRELVTKVATEHHIRDELIEKLEDVTHPWFAEFLESLAGNNQPNDFAIYRRVAMTIRTLAQAGSAVIVGRGGVVVTSGMPGGLHLMLVAPVEYRIRRMGECLQITPDEAALKVREMDRNRQAFYSRYWSNRRLTPENFAITLNTAALTDSQMVASLLPLVVGAQSDSRSHICLEPSLASAQ